MLLLAPVAIRPAGVLAQATTGQQRVEVSAPVVPTSVNIDLAKQPVSEPGPPQDFPEGGVPAGPPPAPNPAGSTDKGAMEGPSTFAADLAGPGDAFGSTSANFPGLTGVCCPPDPTGAVGPNHYVQMINVRIAIFSKTGAVLAGPIAPTVIWQAAGAGGRCANFNRGDPIVLYDRLADRFLISQFAFDVFGPVSECIAISKTADPVAGGWFVYDFQTPTLPDYPKFGVWPTGYFMSSYEGEVLGMFAFDRARMLAGLSATYQKFVVDSLTGGRNTRIIPSHLDGAVPPPAGAPNYFYRPVDGGIHGGADRLEIFEFRVDFTNPANTTCGVADAGAICGAPNTTLTPNAFDNSLCYDTPFPYRNCIPQPGTGQRIDTITDRPMMQLQYRNFGTHEAMVVNNTTELPDATNHAGIRWYEFRKVGAGAWSIYQQGNLNRDADHRWMGSMAMDRKGNIALAYSVSSATTYPSLRYVGRLVSDPLGTLPQGAANATNEGIIATGTSSQTGANAERWGDYSHMTIDPVDDCTFWYTGEYNGNQSTRIASFSFPSCQADQALPGAVTASTGWALRNTLSTGDPTTTFTYGTRPLVPIMGDWNGDGTKTAGTFEAGTFRLRNTNSGGVPEVEFGFGDPRGFPVVGDWNGDGTDDVAVFRNGTWQTRITGSGVTSTFSYGTGTWPSTIPVAGDWNGVGGDGIGVYNYATGAWALRQTADAGAANAGAFTFRIGSTSYPVAGDWNADGYDTVGVKTGTTWSLIDVNATRPADQTIMYGLANDLPVVWEM